MRPIPLLITIAILVTACAGPAPTQAQPSAPEPTRAGSTPTAPTPSATVPPLDATLPSQAVDDPVFRQMLEAIHDDRPELQFQLHPDRLERDWWLDGDVDDGAGPGRLLVVVSLQPGMLTANPCHDPDFVQGGRCTRARLPVGELFLRGEVEANGTVTVVVALVRLDRSGITAESSNFSSPELAGPLLPGPREPPRITRADPVYTLEQLAALVSRSRNASARSSRTDRGGTRRA